MENDDSDDSDKTDLDWEDIKTLCYEDVTLAMLPNPEGGRDILAMEVTLKYTKDGRRDRTRKWVTNEPVLRC